MRECCLLDVPLDRLSAAHQRLFLNSEALPPKVEFLAEDLPAEGSALLAWLGAVIFGGMAVAGIWGLVAELMSPRRTITNGSLAFVLLLLLGLLYLVTRSVGQARRYKRRFAQREERSGTLLAPDAVLWHWFGGGFSVVPRAAITEVKTEVRQEMVGKFSKRLKIPVVAAKGERGETLRLEMPLSEEQFTRWWKAEAK
jgi:hypothetical protein